MFTLPFDLPRELYSGSDSEQRRRRRNAQVKDRNIRGNPGSRRFRRFLNSILSDYESDAENSAASDAEGAREADRIVDFEWSGHFTQIGREFYDGTNVPLGVPRPNRAERAKERARRRRHQEERKHVRREPRCANSRLLREQQQPGGAAEEGKLNLSSPPERKDEEHDHDDDKEGAPVAAQRKRSNGGDSDSSDSDAAAGGQEAAPELYQLIEHKYRKLFKKLSDTEFLHELEQVMLGFKSGRLTALDATQLPLQHFTVSAESGDAEGEEKLTVHFHSQFSRELAHGLAQFHHLIPTDAAPTETSRYKAFLKRPRRGLSRAHTASLCVHLQRLMAARRRQQRELQR